MNEGCPYGIRLVFPFACVGRSDALTAFCLASVTSGVGSFHGCVHVLRVETVDGRTRNITV
jgi:hypothetical protein